jgi:type II secretory pathway pseudopilin PulG
MIDKPYNKSGIRPDAGMSLVGALLAVLIVGISATAVMQGVNNYYRGKTKLNALDSAKETERAIVAEAVEAVRTLVLGGCAPTSQTAFRNFSKATPFGTLSRVNNRNQLTISGTTQQETRQSAFLGATNARNNSCPGSIPTPGSNLLFTTCFQFTPSPPSGPRLASHAFLRSSLIFIKLDSRVIDLRNNNPLSCNQVARSTLRSCSFARQASGICGNVEESSFLGSGVRHSYSLFWETGGAGNKIYNMKQGVLYVPNSGRQL